MSMAEAHPEVAKTPVNRVVAAFLLGYHLLAAAAFAFPFELRYLPIMAGMYLWMGFATTFYLHRCLTHRSFETTLPIKFFFFLGTAVGQQGEPVTWVGLHRRHHAIADTPEDVTGPVASGFFHSHVGWIFQLGGEADERARQMARDVETSQPFLKWFPTPGHMLLPHLAMAGLLAATLGPASVLWCLYLPMVVVYHITWCVNSFCHMWGYRRTDTPDQSYNFWPIGILGLGEGWHNNHHAAQSRATAGWVWWEVDATTYLIWVLEKLGLVWNVRWDAPARSVPQP